MILLMYLLVKLKDCFSNGVEVFGRGMGVISFKKRVLLGLEFRKVKKLMGVFIGVKICINILYYFIFLV